MRRLCVCVFLHPTDVSESTYELSVDHTHQQGMSLPLNVPSGVATPTVSQKGPHSEPVLGVFGRAGQCGSAPASWGVCMFGCMYICRSLDRLPTLTGPGTCMHRNCLYYVTYTDSYLIKQHGSAVYVGMAVVVCIL